MAEPIETGKCPEGMRPIPEGPIPDVMDHDSFGNAIDPNWDPSSEYSRTIETFVARYIVEARESSIPAFCMDEDKFFGADLTRVMSQPRKYSIHRLYCPQTLGNMSNTLPALDPFPVGNVSEFDLTGQNNEEALRGLIIDSHQDEIDNEIVCGLEVYFFPNVDDTVLEGLSDDEPLGGVNWQEAKELCWAQGKRLPTEGEWEKAALGPEGDRSEGGYGVNNINFDGYEWVQNAIIRGGIISTIDDLHYRKTLSMRKPFFYRFDPLYSFNARSKPTLSFRCALSK